jgi:hypothetical protein
LLRSARRFRPATRARQHAATLIEDDDSPSRSRALGGQEPCRTSAATRIEDPVPVLNRRANEHPPATAICPSRDQRVLRVVPAGKPIIKPSKSVGIQRVTHNVLRYLRDTDRNPPSNAYADQLLRADSYTG